MSSQIAKYAPQQNCPIQSTVDGPSATTHGVRSAHRTRAPAVGACGSATLPHGPLTEPHVQGLHYTQWPLPHVPRTPPPSALGPAGIMPRKLFMPPDPTHDSVPTAAHAGTPVTIPSLKRTPAGFLGPPGPEFSGSFAGCSSGVGRKPPSPTLGLHPKLGDLAPSQLQ